MSGSSGSWRLGQRSLSSASRSTALRPPRRWADVALRPLSPRGGRRAAVRARRRAVPRLRSSSRGCLPPHRTPSHTYEGSWRVVGLFQHKRRRGGGRRDSIGEVSERFRSIEGRQIRAVLCVRVSRRDVVRERSLCVNRPLDHVECCGGLLSLRNVRAKNDLDGQRINAADLGGWQQRIELIDERCQGAADPAGSSRTRSCPRPPPGTVTIPPAGSASSANVCTE